MRKLLTIVLGFIITIGSSQTKIGFENFNLSKGQFLNGSDKKGGFNSGNVYLPNFYNSEFNFWGGWAISAVSDSTTEGYLNEFGSLAGSGTESSSHFAVAYGAETTLVLKGEAKGKKVESITLNTSTYPGLSMKKGDAFAKKFGGASGNDKDFFNVTIKAWFNGKLSTDSVNFYFADFRFDDNSKDYIVKNWQNVELAKLGNVDSLQFVLNSSDVGSFGINTPTYFCLDNVVTSELSVAIDEIEAKDFLVYPNPTSEFIELKGSLPIAQEYLVYDIFGRLVLEGKLNNNRIEVRKLIAGSYVLFLGKSQLKFNVNR
jgi:hypothetical protein